MKTSEASHTAVITTARSVVSLNLVEPDGYGHFVAQNTLYVLCRGVLYGSGGTVSRDQFSIVDILINKRPISL